MQASVIVADHVLLGLFLFPVQKCKDIFVWYSFNQHIDCRPCCFQLLGISDKCHCFTEYRDLHIGHILNLLPGRKSTSAFQTLPSPANSTATIPRSRIDHLAVVVTAKWTSHNAIRNGPCCPSRLNGGEFLQYIKTLLLIQ